MRIKFYLITLIFILVLGCARRGNPTGGPKDEDAPILINTIPALHTVNFKENEIRIYFDEYIKLNDIQKQLVISPPLKYDPIITPLGLPSKRVSIKIKDTLKTNTTYVFNFGQSIEDHNEGNTLSNFKYVFSTGNHIDSLSLKGTIKDAFNKKADDFVSVMLYEYNDNFNDSTIFKEKPYYIANTLDSLSWQLTNLKAGKYKLIALKENANANFVFNPDQDKIGFLDSIISIPNDNEIKINLFKEEPKFKLAKPSEVAKGHLIFGYYGNANKLTVAPINKINGFKSVSFFDKQKDSLYYFFKGIDKDSIDFKFSNNDFEEIKTVKLRLKEIDSLKVSKLFGSVLHKRDTLKIAANNPIEKIDKTKISLFDKDTLAVDFNTLKTAENELSISFVRKSFDAYKLTLLPNSIVDFFGQKNDTLKYNFRTKKDEFYGSLTMKIKTDQYPLIVQLLTNNNEIVSSKYSNKEKDFVFNDLVPGSYIIRVITDENGNKKWDSGNYLLKKQPESVLYFNKEIEIKENWFLNETFIIEN